MKLQDTVAIVTGAGSGIGLAITQRFLAEGARVVAGDIAEEHLAVLQKLPGVTAVRADVTVQADLDRLVAAAEDLGRLDIVVNNAGIMDRFLPVAKSTTPLGARAGGQPHRADAPRQGGPPGDAPRRARRDHQYRLGWRPRRGTRRARRMSARSTA